MADRTSHIWGKVINLQTQVGVSRLRVEAWGKDLLVDDFVGEATTDPDGGFHMEFAQKRFKELFLNRDPESVSRFTRAGNGHEHRIHSQERRGRPNRDD